LVEAKKSGAWRLSVAATRVEDVQKIGRCF
jgi:hypothetical protein